MVKRKAAVSLDDWLVERRVISEDLQLDAGNASGPCTDPAPPAAEVVLMQEDSEFTTASPTEVAATEEEAADWFWALLEKTGFELW